MAENRLTHMWIYNICVCRDEPYMLLTQRVGHEGRFYHVVCQTFVTNLDDSVPSIGDFLAAAPTANLREAALATQNQIFSPLCLDITGDSSGDRNIHCHHILADHGRYDSLPAIAAQAFDTPAGKRGLAEAVWAKLTDIQISPEPARVDAAASAHISYNGLPLRTTIARNIDLYLIPHLQLNHGPCRDLERLRFTAYFPTGLPEPSPKS